MSHDEIGIRIFAGSSNLTFTEKMCAYLGIERGQAQTIKFSEGNTFVKIHEKVRDKDVYLVQSIALNPNDEFMELLFWIDAFKRSSANSVTAIIPYFGYAKGDKKDEPRVSIRARVCADCLESAGVDRIIAMDLHADQIQGFFNVPVDHLFGSAIFAPYIENLKLQNLTVSAPDMGGSKRANAYSRHLQSEMVLCYKLRKKPNIIEEMSIIGDVEGRNVVIIDDMIDTAGTLVLAADMMKERGAESIRAFATHPILSGNAVERIDNSALEELVVSDSVPFINTSKKIKVLSIADIFAKTILAVTTNQSISTSFVF